MTDKPLPFTERCPRCDSQNVRDRGSFNKCMDCGHRETEWQMTFDEMAKVEPLLDRFRAEAKSWQRRSKIDEQFCANAVWYGFAGHYGIKPRLRRIVGWERLERDDLCTEEAYKLAFQTIYDELPNCRDCGCMKVISG